MSPFAIAFSLFLLMDPIGNIPLYISLLKKLAPKRQLYVITREMLIALVIIILFNFVGNGILNFLHVTQDTVQIAGGIILFIIAIRMIFPSQQEQYNQNKEEEEPFIVPLAVPLVAGPSVLAAVMLYSPQAESSFEMIGAILLAWVVSLIVLLLSPAFNKLLGWRGILACERLMGLILTMISIQMLLGGISLFMKIEKNQ